MSQWHVGTTACNFAQDSLEFQDMKLAWTNINQDSQISPDKGDFILYTEFNVLFFYSAGININKVKTETKHMCT